MYAEGLNLQLELLPQLLGVHRVLLFLSQLVRQMRCFGLREPQPLLNGAHLVRVLLEVRLHRADVLLEFACNQCANMTQFFMTHTHTMILLMVANAKVFKEANVSERWPAQAAV